MLNARAIKQHGMKDDRWTIKNKLTHYKGLIRLYERDAKILQTDYRIAERKQLKEFQELKKNVAKQRLKLGNANEGDRQQIRNILSEDKNVQMAFAHHPIEKIIDHMQHKNFNQRKLLDRLQYTMKKKLNNLAAYKLECSELQDNLNERYASAGKSQDQTIQGQIISGKVQEIKLKQEAAIEIRAIYKNILHILHKDSLYFDAVLNQLKLDYYNQGQSIFNSIEIGQLSIEYTDDRKQEFTMLRTVIKRDMHARMVHISVVQEEARDMERALAMLVQKDSDVNTGKIILPIKEQDIELHSTLQGLETILQSLQDTMYTNRFEDISPCIQEQRDKMKQMVKLYDNLSKDKKNLLNKCSHAKDMYSQLCHGTNSSTFEYIMNKIVLKTKTDKQEARSKRLKENLLEKSNVLAQLHATIFHLRDMCDIVNVPGECSDTTHVKIVDANNITRPKEVQTNLSKIIVDLTAQLVHLTNADEQKAVKMKLPPLEIEFFYEQFITGISNKIEDDADPCVDSLELVLEYKDPQVPSRKSIKKESRIMVEQFLAAKDL